MASTRKRYKNTNQLYYGDEPVFRPTTGSHSNIEIISALSYYNIHLSQDDAKNELLKYAKQHYSQDIIKKIETLKWVCNVGALCRMHERGCIFSDDLLIHKKIMQLLDNVVDKKAERSIIKSIRKTSETKKDETGVKYWAMILLDYIEDEALRRTFIKPNSLEKFLERNKVPHKNFKEISDILREKRSEVESAYSKSDSQIAEGYSLFGKKELKQYLALYDYFIDGLVGLSLPKPRKPRKTKPIDVAKKLAKVKYQKQCQELNLTSIEPKQILDNSGVVLYNTRYKTISILIGDKLDIKGTTIYGFDESKSIKKIVRKPEEILPKIKSSSKSSILDLVNQLKTKQNVPVGTLNENTIILEILK